jgi:tetratricopeptide (TPR) repeat protein
MSFFGKIIKRNEKGNNTENDHEVDALVNKGNSLGNIGRFDQALKCYNEALEIKPKNEDV